MDTARAEKYGIKSQINIEKGIKETIEWYNNNKNNLKDKYNVFKSQY